MTQRRILLIIGGGIAAYKALELIRLCKRAGIAAIPVMTKAAKEFVTPLSVAGLAGEKVYDELFSLTDEVEMGHIALSRAADLVVVAPATANLIARMAHGMADEMATVALLATDKKILIAPAMNVRMCITRRRSAISRSLSLMACRWSGRIRVRWLAVNSVLAALPSRQSFLLPLRPRSRARRVCQTPPIRVFAALALCGGGSALRPPCAGDKRADA